MRELIIFGRFIVPDDKTFGDFTEVQNQIRTAIGAKDLSYIDMGVVNYTTSYPKEMSEKLKLIYDYDQWRISETGAILEQDAWEYLIKNSAVVVDIHAMHPRSDRYGVPFESTAAGMLITAANELYLVDRDVNNTMSAEDTGDDSCATVEFTLAVSPEMLAHVLKKENS